jgi:hypothetical protein
VDLLKIQAQGIRPPTGSLSATLEFSEQLMAKIKIQNLIQIKDRCGSFALVIQEELSGESNVWRRR